MLLIIECNSLDLVIQVIMMMGIAVTLGLVFLQADDDFVGVQDKCVICCMLLV